MNSLEAARKQLADARAAGDKPALRNAYLDLFKIFAQAVSELRISRDFRQGEAILSEWEKSLEEAKPELNEIQQLYSRGQQQSSGGYFWESQGLAMYFLEGNYVEAPVLLEKAEVHHERASRLLAKVPVPADNAAWLEMQKKTVAMEDTERLRVRGMKLLVQGDYESEAGDFARAIQVLEDSVATLDKAERQSPKPADSDAVAAVMEEGKRELHFRDFAQALLDKSKSDLALFQGKLSEAAESQKSRAEALERCQTMHARAGSPMNESFARRLARDVHVARQRHERLLSQAKEKPRWEWLKAILFFVLAMGAAALLIWLTARFEWAQNKGVLAMLLFFIMAVAGIGAQQVNWKDAANWLKGASPSR